MNIPLIDRSIRNKLLIIIIGFIIFLRITMMIVHHVGQQAMIEKAASNLESALAIHQPEIAASGIVDSIRAEMKTINRRNIYREALISIILLAFIIGVVSVVARRISRPLTDLTETARAIAKGDFSATGRLQENSNDEVGTLAKAFAEMSARLKFSTEENKATLAAAEQARRKLELFFQQSTDILGIADYDTRIVYANPAFLKTLGYPREELIGISYLDLVHEDDMKEAHEAVISLGQGNNLIAFENRFRRRDGEYRRIAWNVASDMETRQIYAAGRDVTEERNLEDEVVRATAAEQERIARDLHDSLGQLITGLAYKAKRIESDLRSGSQPDATLAAELVSLANRAGEEARSLARGIDPVELQHGLAAALEYLAITTTSTFNIPCRFTDTTPDAAIEKAKATHLYRIAQEAVNNAVKHSKARHIDVALARDDGYLLLTIIDDGCGIIRRPAPTGHGLRIMEYRAKLIGGTLKITPREACGLVVKCTVYAGV